MAAPARSGLTAAYSGEAQNAAVKPLRAGAATLAVRAVDGR